MTISALSRIDCELKLVAKNQDYIAALRSAINQRHHCISIHIGTVPVHETFHGKTVWKGDVEVFSLINHPNAKRAYAWAYLKGENDESTGYVAVLEIPPVHSAKTAVQASIMSDSKNG